MSSHPSIVLPTVIAALFAGLVVACGSTPPDPGLLQAPGFSDESGRLARPWRFAHHASTDSYRLEIKDDVATIKRVGPEPWSQLVQPIPKEAIKPLAGRRMAFSVDIRADLDNQTFGPPLEPSALSVRIWSEQPSRSRGVNTMLGGPSPDIKRLNLPSGSLPGWKRFTLEFTMPERPARLEVSAVMASGGWLAIRNPTLIPIEP